MRKEKILNPVHLTENKWIFVYASDNYDFADKVFENLKKSCNQLGMVVEKPSWIELSKENNRDELDLELRKFVVKNNMFNHPVIVVCLLRNENNYPMFKEIMQTYRMASQVITVRNAKSFNLSKASNILKQINSKAGGDLYNFQFPETFAKKRTMLIGIDVCHAGPQSIVGLSASIN